jgi:hypothetical protein
LRAIREFVAQANAALATIRGSSGFVPSPGNLRPGPESDGLYNGEERSNSAGSTWRWSEKKQKWIKVKSAADGGLISGPGSSTSDSIPAMLSNGEYVIRAKAVSSYGLDFMNALNQQKVSFAPSQPSFNASGSTSGSQMVYLSPEDRALLRAAVDRPIALYTENTKIAQSANAGNVLLAQRGTN